MSEPQGRQHGHRPRAAPDRRSATSERIGLGEPRRRQVRRDESRSDWEPIRSRALLGRRRAASLWKPTPKDPVRGRPALAPPSRVPDPLRRLHRVWTKASRSCRGAQMVGERIASTNAPRLQAVERTISMPATWERSAGARARLTVSRSSRFVKFQRGRQSDVRPRRAPKATAMPQGGRSGMPTTQGARRPRLARRHCQVKIVGINRKDD
jgi:hypothetical protein